MEKKLKVEGFTNYNARAISDIIERFIENEDNKVVGIESITTISEINKIEGYTSFHTTLCYWEEQEEEKYEESLEAIHTREELEKRIHPFFSSDPNGGGSTSKTLKGTGDFGEVKFSLAPENVELKSIFVNGEKLSGDEFDKTKKQFENKTPEARGELDNFQCIDWDDRYLPSSVGKFYREDNGDVYVIKTNSASNLTSVCVYESENVETNKPPAVKEGLCSCDPIKVFNFGCKCGGR